MSLKKTSLKKLCLFVSSCGLILSACKDSKTSVIVGTSADYPPFEYFDNGEIVGFEIALIKEIMKRLEMDVTVKDMSFDGIVAALQSKRIDLAIANITATPARAKKVDFTLPYHTIKPVFVVKKDDRYNKLSDFENKIIGAQFGSVFEMMAKNDLPNDIQGLRVHSLNRVPDLIQDFKNGRVDAILVGKTEGQAVVDADPQFKLFILETHQDAASIALPKGSELTEKVNDVIREMKKDGSLKQFVSKWNL